jgi:UDP-N-acetylmuramate dehydrogenase
MKVFNEPLSNHTTLRIGGLADCLTVPESEEDFIKEIIYAQKQNLPIIVIGKGSNILFREEGFKGIVLKNTLACTHISCTTSKYLFIKRHCVMVGSSVSLQKFVTYCVNNNIECLEYLYPIPGTIGGAIYMNAGLGRRKDMCISDKLLSVKIFDGEKIQYLGKEECVFEYRSSIFHKRKWYILEACFKLGAEKKEKGQKRIEQRLGWLLPVQEREKPNAGSIFKEGYHDTQNIRGHRIGNAQFSNKTTNWIINLGHATADDVLKLIEFAKREHINNGLPEPILEIEIY